MCDWLLSTRKEQALTQEALASKVGVTRQMIAAIERGVATPSVKVAKALANILDVDWTAFYDNPASFLHFLTFHLKNVFNDVLNVRTEAGRNAHDRYAVSLDAPVSGDTEDITLADTLIDPEAEEVYNHIIITAWRWEMRGILEKAIINATENKPEARAILLYALEKNVSLPEAARRQGLDPNAAKRAKETTRAAIIRYINKYERDI